MIDNVDDSPKAMRIEPSHMAPYVLHVSMLLAAAVAIDLCALSSWRTETHERSNKAALYVHGMMRLKDGVTLSICCLASSMMSANWAMRDNMPQKTCSETDMLDLSAPCSLSWRVSR